jgi:hypothetical protein
MSNKEKYFIQFEDGSRIICEESEGLDLEPTGEKILCDDGCLIEVMEDKKIIKP